MKINERYSILRHIGRGGTADVYSAHDRKLGRNVALKLPRRSSESSAKLIRHLIEKEAGYYARLEHPNILPIYDYFDSRLGPILVLRQAPQDLETVVRTATLTEEAKLHLLSQVADALDYCCTQGFAHRDVKPGNILVDAGGHAYVCDFSCSAPFDDNTRWVDLVGTAAYLGPELLHRRRAWLPCAKRQRYDQFSFGVLVFRLLAGQLPFEIHERAPFVDHCTALRLLRGEPLRSPHEANPEVPGPVESVVSRLLHLDGDERYASAAEACRDLGEIYQGRAREGIRVFISYCRRDTATVQPWVEALRREGFNLWWDQDILPGGDWDEQIERAMEECQVMAVFVSRNAIQSKEVKHEWTHWLELEKPIVPVIVDGTVPSYRLSSLQRVVVTGLEPQAAARAIGREMLRFAKTKLPKGNGEGGQSPSSNPRTEIETKGEPADSPEVVGLSVDDEEASKTVIYELMPEMSGSENRTTKVGVPLRAEVGTREIGAVADFGTILPGRPMVLPGGAVNALAIDRATALPVIATCDRSTGSAEAIVEAGPLQRSRGGAQLLLSTQMLSDLTIHDAKIEYFEKADDAITRQVLPAAADAPAIMGLEYPEDVTWVGT